MLVDICLVQHQCTNKNIQDNVILHVVHVILLTVFVCVRHQWHQSVAFCWIAIHCMYWIYMKTILEIKLEAGIRCDKNNWGKPMHEPMHIQYYQCLPECIRAYQSILYHTRVYQDTRCTRDIPELSQKSYQAIPEYLKIVPGRISIIQGKPVLYQADWCYTRRTNIIPRNGLTMLVPEKWHMYLLLQVYFSGTTYCNT